MIDALSGISGISGLGAVGKTLLETKTTATPGATPGQATGASFGEVLTEMASDAMNNIRQGEAMSFAGIQGKASTREVVDAVMQAEQSLQTAISIRDKVVSAFLDVTKMQI
ncbi:flagellar hook-basal body complex protein FliE [Gellertiella hungarica]|uniref:Flagellar hook-basal body complex protein FliE n=1 Tax=Gellertiella hungarica TaxID=1572859 RepID=A0A7W6NJ84_9HYPH|nr:flagellar hook-basal body complex protein FliE [Gellertiella hungarica]MBB4064115.1 flagellar hook-basal body complex protein FliE [Gellertiella hungarica]